MPFLILFMMIAWPVLEVASIMQMARWVGSFQTFLLLAAGFVFGLFLIRSQSRILALRMVNALRTGEAPQKALIQSGTVSLAGMLFMVPGFISDAAAAVLLIPQMRDLIVHGIAARFGDGIQRRSHPHASRQESPYREPPYRADDVIDVEFTEVPRGQGSGASSAKRADSPWGNPR